MDNERLWQVRLGCRRRWKRVEDVASASDPSTALSDVLQHDR